MLDHHRNFAKKGAADRQHLFDKGGSRDNDITLDTMIGQIRQARDVDQLLPARSWSVNPTPDQRMLRWRGSIGVHRCGLKPMPLPMPGMARQSLVSTSSGMNGGPIRFDALLPGLAQHFCQCPLRREI